MSDSNSKVLTMAKLNDWSEYETPPECQESNYGSYAVKNISVYRQDFVDDILFEGSKETILMGSILPVLISVGVVGNLFVGFMLNHRDMRSLCSMFMQAMMITKAFYLLVMSLVIVPKFWIFKVYESGDHDSFWDHLAAVQNTYIYAYPLYRQTGLLSDWYMSALIVEQYAAYSKPEEVAKWSMGDLKIKVIITLLNATILIHFVDFFKFTRQGICITHDTESESAHIYLAELICLSTIYREEGYLTYEKYIYFVFFQFLPYFLTLGAFVDCILSYRYSKTQVTPVPILDLKALRRIQSGRSVITTLCMTGAFLLLKFVIYSAYIATLTYDKATFLDQECHLNPSDSQFLNSPAIFVYLLTFGNMLNAIISPWICLFTHGDLKTVLKNSARNTIDFLQHTGRKLYLILDCTRPSPPPEDTDQSRTGSNIELVTMEGAAAPYSNGTLHIYENSATGERQCLY